MQACTNTTLKKRGTPRLPIPKITARARGAAAKTPTKPACTSPEPLELAAAAQPTVDRSETTTEGPHSFDRERDKTVTVKQAAYALGKSPDTIRLWLRTGRLTGWQPGGRRCAVAVSESSVKAALECSLG